MLFGSKAAQVTADAGTAAAGAYASAAATPWIGWLIAPGAAAEAEAAVLSFAEKGFDVPPGVSPITQLHSREMVLPAPHADVIRRMASGTGGGGGTANINSTFNIQSLDPSRLSDIVSSNPGIFAQAVAAHYRSGAQMNLG